MLLTDPAKRPNSLATPLETIESQRMSRCMRLLTRMVLALALAAIAVGGPAGAEEPPPEQPPLELPAELLIEGARAALDAGNVDDAAFLLEGVEPGEGNVDDLDFLWGTIALARGAWQEAIDRFRAMLARDPTLLRVRLDLAFAYFQAEEDSSAGYHFRQVLAAEELPPVVRARTLNFLDRIRRRKTWSITGSVAIAPDTNINAATSARQVNFFGLLPATLSDDARETSGLGIVASIGGGYEWRLEPDLRLRTSASLSTRTYGQSQYNEQILSLRAGPRIFFEQFDLRPELTARGRQLGGDTYSRAAGLELSSNWVLAPTWLLSGSLGAERISYTTFLGEGSIYAAQLGLTHALDQATLLRVDWGYRIEDLDEDSESWREVIVGASVTRELPEGFVVTAGPSFRWRGYGAPKLTLGPDPRGDATVAGRITVSNRQIDLFGFMPELTVRHEVRDSNLVLHEYERSVAELGLIRTF